MTPRQLAAQLRRRAGCAGEQGSHHLLDLAQWGAELQVGAQERLGLNKGLALDEGPDRQAEVQARPGVGGDLVVRLTECGDRLVEGVGAHPFDARLIK